MARQTVRQRQSKKISRSKAAKKKIRTFRMVGMGVVAFVLLGFVTGGGWWLVGSGRVDRWGDSISDGIYGLTADAGFAVRQVYIEGRDKTPSDKVKDIVTVEMGDPLLAVPVKEMQEKLERLHTVKTASVERELPDILRIHLHEREPVALWQMGGILNLIDEEGKILKRDIVATDSPLMVVVGKGAPEHIHDLFTLISKEPSLAKRVTAAVWVGERRWNVKLDNGVSVLLPEENPEGAWQRLASMHQNDKILEKNITSIDLRIEEKVFIKIAPDRTGDTDPSQET